MDGLPLWLTNLSSSDLTFMKQFVLASGSLREMAKIYGISYPTVRSRLDQLIEKVRDTGEEEDDSYIKLIRRLALEDKVSFEAASVLIREYREEKKNAF